MVYKNYRWASGRWCRKTAVRWVGDGAQKPPLGVWATVRENRHGVDGRWCTKTTVGRMGDSVQKPPWIVRDGA